MTPVFFFGLFLLLTFCTLVVLYLLYIRARAFDPRALSLELLRVKLAKKENEKDPDLVKEIALSEQLVSSLASLDVPFSLEIAVHSVGEEINFYIAVPKEKSEFVMRQVQGFFPNAHVESAPFYELFAPKSAASVATLRLAHNDIVPLRTYAEASIDTFAPIVSTLSKLREEGEGAVVQFVMRPAKPKIKAKFLDALKKLKKGESLRDILGEKSLIEHLGTMTKMDHSEDDKDQIKKEVFVDEEAVKALTAKMAKPLFNVNVRIIAGADSDDRAEDIVLAIAGSFSQFATPTRNSIVVQKEKNKGSLLSRFSFRQYDPYEAIVLNTEEIASMFHLPTFTTDVPRIKWIKTREAPPPLNLSPEGIVLGESVFRGEARLVRMKDEDRRRHVYMIGQTGTGKSSSLLLPMAIQDMQAGKGICVIDPHGGLIDDILSHVPKDRIDDVIVFNPADVKRPLSLNMLEYNMENPEEKTFIVNEFLGIFDRLYDLKATGGPQFEQFLRYSLLLLMEDAAYDPPTLVDVPRIFTDEPYRKAKLARIKSPNVIDFWEKEVPKMTGDQSLGNFTPYITSKFNTFLANDFIRPIVAQPKSAFNFRDVMDTKKILLVSLAKGKIGDINAQLLGMVITGRILMAALSRTDIAEEERKDFYFYIDEFQNFTTDSISTILSEARKYRLNLILAHQFIGQLTDDIRDAVFGNVGSMVTFRIGNPDEETFVKIFGPEFTEKDLISLDNFNVVAKLLIDGQP
ncbi:MAG: type IV secretory system conjugative DNA transfer family protein, partial [Patescibacteria group bacterium]